MEKNQPPLALRLLKGFGMFWWDFLVGDTPELFVAALVIVAAVTVLRIVWQLNAIAVAALPLLAIVALGVSVFRAQRAARK
jgi:ABC-type bacteriocin/lantibiotic exporter with double-glycine peptidase domain